MNKFQILAELVGNYFFIDENWFNSFVEILTNSKDTTELQAAMKTSAFVIGSDVEETRYSSKSGSTGVIRLDGPIFSGENFFTRYLGGVNLEIFKSELQALVDDSSVDEILMIVSSPGGSTFGLNEGSSFIREMSSKKKITGFTPTMNASAAYYLSSACDALYCSADAMIGSIGVITSVANPKEDTYYLTFVNTDSPNKRPNPTTDSGKKEIIRNLDSLAAMFFETVAMNRGTTVENVKANYGKGGLLVGREAVAAGMVDGVSTLNDVLAKCSNNKKGAYAMKDLNELKEKHPDLYNQAVALGKLEASKDMPAPAATPSADIAAKDAQINALMKSVEDANAQNTALTGRISALEKQEEIRKTKEAELALRASAGKIFSDKMVSSGLPERVTAKITVDYNNFVSGAGALDAEAYGAAIDKEITEWKGIVGDLGKTPVVMGITTPPKSSGETTEETEANTAAVDRMSTYLNIGKEDK